jgi:hypothetical protein
MMRPITQETLTSRLSRSEDLAPCKSERRRAFPFASIAAISGVATLLVLPFLIRGNIAGHDYRFHLQLWLETGQQWRQGIVYPRWAESAGYGHGDPRFVFYPPLSWMLGGLLSALLPIQFAPIALMFLALLTAGFAMYRAVLEVGDARTATWAAVLYVANPYHALILYRRSDYAELIASAIFPVAILYLSRLTKGARGASVGFALSVCALWLSNLPAALICTYVLSLMLVTAAVCGRTSGAVRGAMGIFLGIGLAGFFLFPATYEQRWVYIAAVLRRESNPSVNFLFEPWAGWMQEPAWWYQFNLLVSLAAVATICIAAVGWLLCEPMKIRQPRFAAMLMAATVVCAVMMFAVSHPVWELIPKLRFVQFPWRFLLPLCFTTATFVAHARVAEWLKFIGFGPTLAVMAVVLMFAHTWTGDAVAHNLRSSFEGGYVSVPEYVPRGAQSHLISDNFDRVSLRTSTARATVIDWSAERVTLAINSPSATELTLRRAWYPAWRAEIDGRSVTPNHNETGDITLQAPAGSNLLRVWFARTWDQTLGDLISIASLVILMLIAYRQFLTSTGTRTRDAANTFASRC